MRKTTVAPSIVVVIREDPRKTHRPVEALRIALGLGTGDNALTVVLLGDAARLLAQDEEDLVDIDILSKYLPSLQQTETPFVLLHGTAESFDLDPGFNVRHASFGDIASLVASADRAVVF